MHPHFELRWIDGIILALYVAFVRGTGITLGLKVTNSDDLSFSSAAHRYGVTGPVLMSANLGAQELKKRAACGAKNCMAPRQVHWAGAVPATAFLAVFMTTFLYVMRLPKNLLLGLSLSLRRCKRKLRKAADDETGWHRHILFCPSLLSLTTMRRLLVGNERRSGPERGLTPESAAAALRSVRIPWQINHQKANPCT